MHVAIDAVGTRTRGGAALLRDFLKWLPIVRPSWKWTVYLLPPSLREFPDPEPHPQRTVEHVALGDSGAGRMVWLSWEIHRRLRASHADILLSFANIGAQGGSIPRVTYSHQALAFPDPGSTPARIADRIRLAVIRSLILNGAKKDRYFIVQTEDMRRRVLTAAPWLEPRMVVLPGSVSWEDSQEIRDEKRVRIDGAPWPRLLYVAAPSAYKNHATLIRALPALADRFPESKLLLTLDSDSESWDDGYVTGLRGLAAELRVERHVEWLGSLSRTEVRYALHNCSIAIFPSLIESFGLPLAEAIVEGCPLAASDLAYAHDVAGDASAYFDPLDPKSIADVATAVLEQPQLRERIRRQQALRSARFDPRNLAESIAQRLEAASGR
jgi:glycosyltransferase involved in cell wall biosynthesis